MPEPYATFLIIAVGIACWGALGALTALGMGWVIDRLDPSHKEGS